MKGLDGNPIPILHWGDIDLGGLRIFEFIKKSMLPSFIPLWMDIEALRKYEQKASTISDAYAEQIAAALEDSRYRDWKPETSAAVYVGKACSF